ncbi:MAG: DUF2155 domain-containing protein [Alphaproteobacteria bacterium]
MRLRVLALVLTLAGPAGAEILHAKGVMLRMLDKSSGIVTDYDLASGQSKTSGRLTIQLDDCRYPSDLPTGEAYAHLTILDSEAKEPAFKGWMIASSPALSALDNPRYDVWVLRCDVPEADMPATTAPAEGSGG